MEEIIIKVYGGGFICADPRYGGIGLTIRVDCPHCPKEKSFFPEDFPEKIPFDKPIIFRCSGCQARWETKYRFVKYKT